MDDSQEIQQVCKGLHQSPQFNITYPEPDVSSIHFNIIFSFAIGH